MSPMTWTKQPGEKRKLAFDAQYALTTGDTIASYEAKIFNAAGEDLSETMIEDSSNSDTIVYLWVKAGADATIYYVRITITTTAGKIIEGILTSGNVGIGVAAPASLTEIQG